MRSRTRRPVTANLLIALLAAAPARADVAGQQVVSGQATFDQSGNVTTIHASDGAIIDYSRFNVWSNEELHFVQPTNESRVLNRVLGDPTHIDGGLYATSGIYFGPKPIVQVGGLYAAAGDISNKDFLDRIDRFTLSGTVENAGSIESPAVALLGTAVRNSGIIRAPAGTIALVAGEKVLLTQLGSHVAVQVDGAAGGADAPAIEQTGSVDAGAGSISFATGDVYSLAINHTGITRGREIELRAGSGTVQVSGTLDATARRVGRRGRRVDPRRRRRARRRRPAQRAAHLRRRDERAARRRDRFGRRRPRDRVVGRGHRVPRRDLGARRRRGRRRRVRGDLGRAVPRGGRPRRSRRGGGPDGHVALRPEGHRAARRCAHPARNRRLRWFGQLLDRLGARQRVVRRRGCARRAVRHLPVGARGHEREYRAAGRQQHQLVRHVRRPDHGWQLAHDADAQQHGGWHRTLARHSPLRRLVPDGRSGEHHDRDGR
ncbi:MAG: hypothetical protein E6J87_23990 [Deltaproteobacteria bacterium]|nr:MAG: hypothetical protein E6J87_23990 [Deltaproteobacteria bacterium]